jgi:Zn-dependent peptidase ImmA (M78 family)
MTPSVLRWARESAGLQTHEVATEMRLHTWQIEAAEQGDELLTLPQAEKLAHLCERPLAALFMPEPPMEEPLEAQFRRLPGAPELPWPPAMRKLARRIRARQDAAAEILDLLEDESPWLRVRSRLQHRPSDGLPAELRSMLAVTVEQQIAWQDPNGYKPLKAWIDAVESLGVLVMQDGTMAPEVMRGFASEHHETPAIVINSKDDPRARAFTVIHEVAHLVWTATDASGHASEAWCNRFAADVIMPAPEFRAAFADLGRLGLEQRTAALALAFGVTPLAAAVRVARLGLVDNDRGDALVEDVRSRKAPPRSRGGNFYRNKVTWLGPSFIRLVLEAVDEQALTLSSASGLLGAKVGQFDKLRQTLDDRAGASLV